jgi:hypothetical protein
VSEGTGGTAVPEATGPAARDDWMRRLRAAVAGALALGPPLKAAAGSAAAWAWRSVKRLPFWFGVVSFAVFLAVADYVHDIVADGSYLVIKEDDIGIAWANGIARLGIRPVYPPQEDLRVGDIWVIVSNESDSVPVLGKAVRLDTLDLRSEIAKGDRFRPIFPDTPRKPKEKDKPPKEEEYRFVARTEVGPIARQALERPDDKPKTAEDEKAAPANRERVRTEELIATSITAFPAFSIQHVRRSSASWGLGGVLFGGDRKAGEVEQVKVADVETYGAPAWDALQRLVDWCLKAKPELCADDRIARGFLAQALPPQANVREVKDCKYTSRVDLIMISRVFLTREIDSQRWLVDARGARLDLNAAPAAKPAPGTAPANPATATTTTTTVTVAPADDSATASGRLSTFASDKTQMGLKGVFQRPLAFGFRAVSFGLDQRPPEPPDVDKPCSPGGKP